MHDIRRTLAHAIRSRKAYDKIVYLDLHKTLPPDIKAVFREIGDFYEADSECTAADVGAVFDRVIRKYPRYKENYEHLRKSIEECPISEENYLQDLSDQLKSEAALQLVQSITTNQEWTKIAAQIDRLREALETSEGEDLEVVSNVDVQSILKSNDPDSLIKLSPSIMNDYVRGGIKRPSHTVVFARPDIGKTAFVLNLIKGFCKQGLKVLYYNNEDNPEEFLLRSATVFTTVSEEVLRKYPEKAEESLEKNNYHLLNAVFAEDGTVTEIDKLIKELSPDVVVVDQLRNLKSRQESRVLQLEEMAREMRVLGRRHNVVMVSVTQAGDSAEGKAFLSQGDVDYSNTGIQGACDLMIGLGASSDDWAASTRGVSFPKNKRSGHRIGPRLKFIGETGVYE